MRDGRTSRERRVVPVTKAAARSVGAGVAAGVGGEKLEKYPPSLAQRARARTEP